MINELNIGEGDKPSLFYFRLYKGKDKNMEDESKISKTELLKKLISLKNDVDENKKNSASERRQIKKDLDRKTQELKTMITGNKDNIDNIWKRSSDHNKELKELQNIIKWVEKTVIGLLFTIILGFIIKTFFGI